MSKFSEEISAEQVMKEKLNKTSINTKELAELTGFTERGARDILKKFCELHPQFNLNDFKNEQDSYEFKGEWNGILCTLLSVSNLSEYDKRKKKNTIEDIIEKQIKLMESIEKYMDGEDRKFALIDATCVQGKLELELYNRIFDQISLLTVSMSKMSPFLRFQALLSFFEIMKVMPNFIAGSISFYETQLNDYKETAEKEWPDEIGALSFCEDLQDYLLKLLKVKMEGKEMEGKIYEFEVVGRSITELIMLGCFNEKEFSAMNGIILKSKEAILAEHNLNPILEKVKNVLDLNNPFEKSINEWCEKVLLIQAFQREHINDNTSIGRELLRDILIKNSEKLLDGEN